MMVRFVIQYGERPVDLLQQKDPHHLVGEGHFRQRQQCSTPSELFGETVCTADGKDQFAGATVTLFADIGGQVGGIHLLAPFIQQQQRGAGRDQLFQPFALPATHLFSLGTLLVTGLALDRASLLKWGILVLMTTPVARAVVVTIGMLRERDWLFAAVSIWILAVLGSIVYVAAGR